MMNKDYQSMSKQELIDLLIKRENYNKALLTAVRHYAMQLLDELKKLRPEND